MISPVLEASSATAHKAEPPALANGGAGGRLQEVERGLAQLSPPSRSWSARLMGRVTGSVNRDDLQARYEAWQEAQAFGDVAAQVRTLGELRAAFERFQDHCSADDHMVAQRAYADIDAALVRLREQLLREAGA